MGKNKNKRKAGMSGLARFVLDSFKTDNATASSSTEPIQGDSGPTPPPPKKQKLDERSAPLNLSEPVQDEPEPKAPAPQESSVVVSVVERLGGPRYDASGLVSHFEDASEVPEHLQKYFSQRYRLFSRYSEAPGCLLDDEGWFSVTPEKIANQIAERCRCDTILDGFCGVGGNAIAFAQTCNRVIALDVSPTRLALARHNAQIYGVADRIEFIQADYLTFIKTRALQANPRKIDVIFLSPPWGGPSYLSGSTDDQTAEGEHPPYHLSSILPIDGADLFQRSRAITPNIAYFLPRNTVLSEIAELAGEENVEVEEEWTGSKLKALTCYYGGLADDQGHLFESS
ncbi:Tgs1 protein [Ephemerocybe angulata]|uniref:Trimethylguanosine synthase n=1 Tax=Ephemerocybe angulata TaxID=980116 RepID=A0A8H6I1Z8_9AGAR|nr:Tgs1 protein [Tulosesus angulatus]